MRENNSFLRKIIILVKVIDFGQSKENMTNWQSKEKSILLEISENPLQMMKISKLFEKIRKWVKRWPLSKRKYFKLSEESVERNENKVSN